MTHHLASRPASARESAGRASGSRPLRQRRRGCPEPWLAPSRWLHAGAWAFNRSPDTRCTRCSRSRRISISDLDRLLNALCNADESMRKFIYDLDMHMKVLDNLPF